MNFTVLHISSLTFINKTNDIKSNLLIYPNPAHETITIILDEDIKRVSVYTLLGNKKAEFSSNKIDFGGLQGGNYILQIQTSNNMYYKKVVIE